MATKYWQWLEQSANYGIYADVNTNILRLYGVTTTINGSQYRCVVTGTCAPYTVTSGAIHINYQSAVANNPISNSQNLCAGTPVPFTGSTPTGGDGTFTYQWMQNTVVDGQILQVQQVLIMLRARLHKLHNYTHRFQQEAACASINSIAITVTINPATTTTDPKDTTVCAGNTVTFAVTGTGNWSWLSMAGEITFRKFCQYQQWCAIHWCKYCHAFCDYPRLCIEWLSIPLYCKW